MTDESQIKREICEYLESLGDRCLFTVSPPKRTKYSSKFMKKGWPDIYGLLYNANLSEDCFFSFLIEVKTPTGTLGLEQHKILEQAKALGAIAVVATSVEDVRREIR